MPVLPYIVFVIAPQVDIGLIMCKVLFFMGNHLVVLANWILIAMAIERLLAVWKPLHVAHIWNSRRAVLSLVGIFFLTACLHIPILVAVTNNPAKSMCEVYLDYRWALFVTLYVHTEYKPIVSWEWLSTQDKETKEQTDKQTIHHA